MALKAVIKAVVPFLLFSHPLVGERERESFSQFAVPAHCGPLLAECIKREQRRAGGLLHVGRADRSPRVGGVSDRRRHFHRGGSATVGWKPHRASPAGTGGGVKGQHAGSRAGGSYYKGHAGEMEDGEKRVSVVGFICLCVDSVAAAAPPLFFRREENSPDQSFAFCFLFFKTVLGDFHRKNSQLSPPPDDLAGELKFIQNKCKFPADPSSRSRSRALSCR